jgi:hypothetical protein
MEYRGMVRVKGVFFRSSIFLHHSNITDYNGNINKRALEYSHLVLACDAPNSRSGV